MTTVHPNPRALPGRLAASSAGVAEPHGMRARWRRRRSEIGSATAEYASVTACGVGFAGILLKLLTSDFGQSLIKHILDAFLSLVGL